ncbi:helix-turn-helix domain-containing protein [Vagococcus sp. BWB3-3]|uniref:Helix-turn-helix domain-containing protein n=1 Tax=Vagococcus allomyrinae TaxID=2794353 RepID=A0A940P8U7_9ENTE|nr:helix-turn-helix domain-containing protein [Vagococcus allomyrinae]MBP1040225.1 helix-turn-helix domain-containing protein [Vagococcus allomyrinae]
MERLLGKQGIRMLNMITYLYSREWVTLQEISSLTNFNERTLREDIKYLNVHLHPIAIESSKKSGVRLIIPTNYSINYIYYMLLSESIEFSILEAIFFRPYDTADDLAKVLYTSPHVINKAIKRINQVIKKYNFSISSTPIKLIGDEQWITVFFRSYLLEKYDNNIPLDNELIEHVYNAVTSLCQKLGENMKPINRNLLILYVSVRVHRLKQDSSNRYSRKVPSSQSAAVNEFNYELSTYANLNEVNDFFSDICRPSDGQYICLSAEELFSLSAQSARLKEKLDSYSDLLNSIEKKLNFTFHSKKATIFNLYNISLQEEYIIPIIGNKTEFLLNHVKELIPFVYLTVSKIVMEFADHHNVDYTSLLYYVFSSTKEFFTIGRTRQPKLKVALYGRYNNLATTNNWSILTTIFEHQFDITLIESTFEDIREEINQYYDLLITEINDIEVEIDSFCIPFDISTKDIRSLQQYYFDTMNQMKASI